MFVPHDIEGLDKELYGFLSRYAADMYPDESSEPGPHASSLVQKHTDRRVPGVQVNDSTDCLCRA